MSDSTVVGYIAPITTNGDLNDTVLADFLQAVIVGIVGLPPTLVRPRWQPEPPNKPSFGTDWAALGVQSRKPDGFAYIAHQPNAQNAQGQDRAYRQQILSILCSFYGPHAEANGDLLSMGMQIEQNLEAMKSAGFGFIEVDDPIVVPELDHERWLYRVDTGFKLRRVQIYDYPVRNLLGAQMATKTDGGAPEQDSTITLDTVIQAPLFGFDVEAEFIAGFDQGHLK